MRTWRDRSHAMSIIARLHELDRRQQQSSRLSFLAAVIKKFGDDQAGQLAALIAYYGFVSLFPLLLVFVTVLGFVLQGNPSAQSSVLHSTLSQFPVIGNQLQSNVHSLKGSGVGLAIGLLGSLLAGLGLLVIVSTVAAGFVTAGGQSVAAIVGGVLVAFLVNVLLFLAAFRLMTAAEVQTRELLPGVIVAAVLWTILQHVGGYYVDHVVRHAKETSGLFAFVLGLLAWLYLGGQLTLLAAEINVVRARRLWPRSFFSDPLLDADRRALTSAAEVQERIDEQNVEVSFDQSE